MTPVSAAVGSEKLSVWSKVRCSFASISGGLTNLPIDILLLPLYTEVFGVPPYVAGWIALAAGIWDAITDPLVGRLSDRTRTRWGRRRPYFLIGAVPLGFSFWWLFNPIIGSLAASFLAAFLLFRLSQTIVLIPLYSLGAELSTNYDERTSIMSFVRGFGIIGLLIGILIPLVLFRVLTDTVQAYFVMGLSVGAASIVLVLATFLGTKERPAYYAEKKIAGHYNISRAIRIIFFDKPFLFALGGHLLGHTAGGITATLLVYFAIHTLKISEADILITLPVYMISAMAAIFLVWTRVSKKFDKRTALVASLVVSGIGCASAVFAPVGSLGAMAVIMLVAGIGYGGLLVIPYSMLTEIIDLAEIKTGERWEGLYYGIWNFLQKLGVNIAKFLPMLALTWMGYVTATEGQSVAQPAHVATGIRYLFSFGPALLYFAGAAIVSHFPLSRADYEKIRAELDREKTL